MHRDRIYSEAVYVYFVIQKIYNKNATNKVDPDLCCPVVEFSNLTPTTKIYALA